MFYVFKSISQPSTVACFVNAFGTATWPHSRLISSSHCSSWCSIFPTSTSIVLMSNKIWSISFSTKLTCCDIRTQLLDHRCCTNELIILSLPLSNPFILSYSSLNTKYELFNISFSLTRWCKWRFWCWPCSDEKWKNTRFTCSSQSGERQSGQLLEELCWISHLPRQFLWKRWPHGVTTSVFADAGILRK